MFLRLDSWNMMLKSFRVSRDLRIDGAPTEPSRNAFVIRKPSSSNSDSISITTVQGNTR